MINVRSTRKQSLTFVISILLYNYQAVAYSKVSMNNGFSDKNQTLKNKANSTHTDFMSLNSTKHRENGRALYNGETIYPIYSGKVAGYRNPSNINMRFPQYPGPMELDNGM